MTLYPIIQLLMSSTLNSYGSAMSNNQFFFDDMAIVTVLALFMLHTKPSLQLSQSRPTDDLFDPIVIFSIVGQITFCVIFFYSNVALTLSQGWYCSISEASQFLDSKYRPKNASLGAKNYPCYPYCHLTKYSPQV
jgi:magnesium-transporting ATPase (P-type)